MIVDDEPLAVERLQILCAGTEGVSLIGTASDGEAALRLVEALSPDLLLLDISMPGMDGMSVARVLEGKAAWPPHSLDYKRVRGGVLVQERAASVIDDAGWTVPTKRNPTTDELADLLFAWRAVASVKSNAIVLSRGGATIGIGAGQMSRVDASFIAVHKARTQGHDTNGSVMGSDAFFPFRDGIDAAADAGIRAVIQPGGSRRDAEVIAAADEHGMAMVVTGVRHFRH